MGSNTFSSAKGSARGRNGMFAPRYFFVQKVGDLVQIGIMSRRKVFPSPILLVLQKDDATKLASYLGKLLRSGRECDGVGKAPLRRKP